MAKKKAKGRKRSNESTDYKKKDSKVQRNAATDVNTQRLKHFKVCFSVTGLISLGVHPYS